MPDKARRAASTMTGLNSSGRIAQKQGSGDTLMPARPFSTHHSKTAYILCNVAERICGFRSDLIGQVAQYYYCNKDNAEFSCCLATWSGAGTSSPRA
jgi:hypothetical protein